MYDKIKQAAGKYVQEAIETRKYLHQHPEVSYQEFKTTEFIVSELEKLNIKVERPLETGCIGVLEGGKESGRVIALRADIDALPMNEEGEHKSDFLSRNPGAAHCCGHDAHTANLLATAKVLCDLKDEIEGKILFVFQPGEETLPGGGRLLVESGYLHQHDIDAIYGLHTSPMHKPGTIATKAGPLMGATDEFEAEIIGKGGHAARAHEAIDPIVLAAQFVNAAQTIASRFVDPTEAVVVTIGRIEGGTAHNIIPEKVKVWGTVRTLNSDTADLVKEKLNSLLKGITSSAGGSYKLNYKKGYPAVINTDREAHNVLESMGELFGKVNAIEMDRPIMAGEDFAFYQQEFPGCFYFVGSGSEDSGSKYPWHHAKYNVDDRFFDVAIPLMATLAMEH
ncbi:M20 family metallopeptidase [Balneola sp. MJW-20]|uniref:M20 metallopeptidase family protein n=1 Tax=Gracilimonas aurantiaca TaxID=3234185 RepID=UPI003465CCB7